MFRRRWPSALAVLIPALLAANPAETEVLPCAAYSPGAGRDRPLDRPIALPGTHGKPLLDLPPGSLPPIHSPPPKPGEPLRLSPDYRPPARLPEAEYNPNLLYLPERIPDRPLLVNEPHQPSGRFWMNAGYFYGTTQKDTIPPVLAVDGAPTGTPAPGNIFTPFLGDDVSEHHFRSGLQFQAGVWLDEDETFQALGEVFLLESDRAATRVASFGSPAISRLFVDAATGAPGQELVAFPGVRMGVAEVSSEMYLIGAQANLRRTVWSREPAKLDVIGGYRYLRLAETLRIASDSAPTAGGTRTQILDSFEADNAFHGGQIGLAGEYRWNQMFLDVTGTVAFGATAQDNTVAGGRLTTPPGGVPILTAGGLLTGPGNLGDTSVAEFAVVPAAGLTLGYAVADHWRAFVGYRFLYVSDLSRPGKLIDQVVGADRPTRLDATTNFWVQGITLGMEMRY